MPGSDKTLYNNIKNQIRFVNGITEVVWWL